MLRRRFLADLDTDFEVTRGDQRWRLNPSDFVQADLFWLGRKDYWDIRHLRRLIPRGSVLFDVGANFGYYAITLATALRNECRVYAFEPFPPTYECLGINISLNDLAGTITAHRLALSDQQGAANMSIRVSGNSGSARLDNSGQSIISTTLDVFCNTHRIDQLDFLKIDAEGHEERVLRGAAQTIQKQRPLILIELDRPLLRDAGSSVECVVSLLHAYGYSLHVAHRDTLVPLKTLPADVVVNAFALPR